MAMGEPKPQVGNPSIILTRYVPLFLGHILQELRSECQSGVDGFMTFNLRLRLEIMARPRLARSTPSKFFLEVAREIILT